MKIKYLYLKNFIGIYIGTGRSEIEIDFTKGNNRLILLEGANGKGKSSVLSTLHPFASTMDERTEYILKDKDGKKIIIINHEGYDYKIEHHYLCKKKNRTIASYIAKRPETSTSEDDWEELNETGKVTPFKELVKEILDVDESFFRLSRIGSNVTNFIDLKTAERKKYLSLFLSDVDEYLHYHKKVSEKYNRVKLLIKSITEDINKLGSLDELDISKSAKESSISDLKKKIQKFNSQIAKNQGVISTLDPDGNLIKICTDLKESNDELENILLEDNNLLDSIFNQIPDLANIDNLNKKLDDIKNKLTKNEVNLENFSAKLADIRQNKEKDKSDLSSKRSELSKYQTEDTIDDLKTSRDELNEQIDSIEENIKTNYPSFKKFMNNSESDLKSFDGIISSLINKRNSATSSADLAVLNELYDLIDKYEDDFEQVSLLLNNTLDVKKVSLDKVHEKITQYNSNLQFMRQNEKIAQALDKRPKNCHNDDCAFISNALRYKNISNDIEKAESVLEGFKNKKGTIESEYQEVSDKIEVFNKLKSVYDYLENNKSFLVRFPLGTWFDSHSFTDMMKLSENKIENQKERYIEFFNLVIESNQCEKLLEEVTNKLEILINKKDFISSLEKDIERLESHIEGYNSDEEETKSKIKSCESHIKSANLLINKIERIIEVKDRISTNKNQILENTKQINSMNDKYNRIMALKNSITSSQDEISDLEELLEPEERSLKEINLKISKLKDHENKKAELEDKYKTLTLLRDALSPTKGIPLIFINLYLKKTKDICNKLLNIAYKGDLQVVNFDISETDFFIKVRRSNGEVLNDVAIASQGEQALISVAISLALIEQSMKKYNILLLDEIDATLDQNNRRAFLDLLDTQLDVLGIEQAFIISHNREFDSAPIDLILMPGSTINADKKEHFMLNKTVLFKI